MKKFLMPLTMALFSVGVMQASLVGTLSFGSLNPSGNDVSINTSTVFTLGDPLFAETGTGAFAGYPAFDSFGDVTFNAAVGSSLTISSAAFGTFTSTSIDEVVNIPGIVDFYVLGNYVGGTYAPGSGPASLTIGYTQTPPATGGISDSATFSIPPATPPGTPEPASMVLMGSALIGLAMIRRRRKV